MQLAPSAAFSECRTWRYSLTRVWDAAKPLLPVIGLNPSTADETTDDPTIRRCTGFAQDWGYGGLFMLNLFAFRATNPKEMRVAPDPVGAHNDDVIKCAAFAVRRIPTPIPILCAWGDGGLHQGRWLEVVGYLFQNRLASLGLTKSGMPKHPLYISSTTRMQPWTPLPDSLRWDGASDRKGDA